MAAVTTELKIKVTKVGEAQLTKLSASLNQVAKRADAAKIDFKSLADELKKVQTTTGPKSVNDLRNYRNAWRDIADSVDVASKEFKEATAEAAKLDKQLQKTTQRRGGRLRAGAQVAGTVAGAGVFGGPEGALGALGGAVIGGPAGAVVGGAIGAQVGQLRKVVGGTAEYAASLEKLRIALFGVTTSQAEYQQALQFISQTSKDFAIPQDVLTRQFTKLQASVLGAGGSIDDTKVAFNGIVAAVRATGGSLQDVDSALTATAQVFSKGKVSAEELRQQIGERLPGAFTLFAESIGMTPQELDKALEKGQVSLEDFQTFAEEIFKRYGENAKTIADAPASAGDRLQRELAELQGAVGNLVAPIGAAFQQLASVSVRSLTFIIDKLDEFIKKIGGFAKLAAGLGQTAATKVFGPIGGLLANIGIERFFPQGGGAADPRAGIQQPSTGGGLPGIIPAGGGGPTGREPSAEDILKKQLAAGERIAKQLQREIDLRNASNNLERELLRIKFNFEDVVANINANAAERQQRELLNLAERNRLDQENLVTIEARDKKLQEAFKMDFAGLFKQDQGKLQKFISDSQDSLKDLEQVAINVSQGVGSAIADSLVNGIQGLIEGSAKVKDVFANLLKSVGQILMQEGAKMIATYIAIGIAKAFAGLSGGTKFGEMGNFDQAVPGASGFSSPSSFDASGLFGRANGGPISGGRPYLVGEQGPELFMPRAGGAVTSNRELRQAMSQPASSMNFTFETTNIGGTEYVSREQLEAAMATTRRQAASDGAKRGMNMTLDRMQNSPRTRARVGIS